MEESNAGDARERQEGAADDGLRQPPDHEAAEIERLRRKLRDSRAREERAAAEAAEARNRLSQLSAASRSFANAMRVRAVERERFKRRLAAQYAVGRVLAEAVDLDAAAPDIFAILAEELGWNLGVLWKLDEGSKVLRYAGGWRGPSEPPLGVKEASPCRTFARGDGLPGRVWARGEPAWVQDVPGDSSLREEVVVAEDLRTALAFPIRHKDRAFGVFELFSDGVDVAHLKPQTNLLAIRCVRGTGEL